MSTLPIPAVVPAAGKSRRMGQPKLLLLVRRRAPDRPRRAGPQGRRCQPCHRGHAAGRRHRGPARRRRGPAGRSRGHHPRSRPLEMRESVELALDHLGREKPAIRARLDAGRQPRHHRGNRPPDPRPLGAQYRIDRHPPRRRTQHSPDHHSLGSRQVDSLASSGIRESTPW